MSWQRIAFVILQKKTNEVNLEKYMLLVRMKDYYIGER